MQTHDFFTRIIATNALGPNMIPATQEITEIYVCSMCDSEHEDEDSALECCPPEVYHRYKCPVCKTTHRREDDAEKCCPGAAAGQPRQCPVCCEGAESYEDAADCCLHTHPTMSALGRQEVARLVESGTPWPDAVAACVNH
ncbi:hypothetical protein [Xenophilus sp. Marseille-Q4582]|uniref:hypothetical protein n=1 Tax=Xenophilus sp. Marseille-Q4582 TaxID=2866600 RepID=UPI001CE43D4E|nr:hypothetical protein [Xenophilus sp. Marseille-Q4582]